jgi:hypothetical protein
VYSEDVSELVLSRWSDGDWWAIVRTANAPQVVRAAEPRMTPVEVSTEEPFVRRLGYLGDERFELVALAPDVLLVARGRPGSVIHLLQALSEARGPQWQNADFVVDSDVPAHLVLPRPLELPLETPVGLLLARQRSLDLRATPRGTGDIRVELRIHGELPDGAEQNFRTLIESLVATDLGRALGLPHAAQTLQVARTRAGIELSADFASADLAQGVRLLFRAEIAEIVDQLAIPNEL